MNSQQRASEARVARTVDYWAATDSEHKDRLQLVEAIKLAMGHRFNDWFDHAEIVIPDTDVEAWAFCQRFCDIATGNY